MSVKSSSRRFHASFFERATPSFDISSKAVALSPCTVTFRGIHRWAPCWTAGNWRTKSGRHPGLIRDLATGLIVDVVEEGRSTVRNPFPIQRLLSIQWYNDSGHWIGKSLGQISAMFRRSVRELRQTLRAVRKTFLVRTLTESL